MRRILLPVSAGVLLLAGACSVVTRVGSRGEAEEAVLVGAGDVASCREEGDERTARLLDGIEGTIFVTGDAAYPDGSSRDFEACYAPTWGRHKARTRPVPGDHEYRQEDAGPYFDYFGANAGPRDRGYYSYDLGTWHVVALNSNLPLQPGSPQEAWLRGDLGANPAECTLAYWHKPLFSSGRHADEPKMRDLWRVLYEHGVDVVLNGHDHDYERFAPQDPDGRADPRRGIRQFVVGTGGAELRPFGPISPNSEARNSTAHGVLKLTLRSESYQWEFVPVPGKQFRDTGSASCVQP